MGMKNANSVEGLSYLQLDHKIKKSLVEKGVEALSIVEAWKKYDWVKNYVKKKPKEGYFVWVKKQINFPVSTCVYSTEENVVQDMVNLTVIEPNLKIKGLSLCSSLSKINATHIAKGIVVVKRNSVFDMSSNHSWHEGDKVNTDYEYFLEKNSKLNYVFKDLNPPSKGFFKLTVHLDKKANAKTKTIIDAKKSEITTDDTAILEGKNSSATVAIRVVGRKNSKIWGWTKAVANASGKAHLDCTGLLIDKNSRMELIPKLVLNNKDAILTHEASIGKIADEQLNYLRSRGLSEREAIELIVAGFLRG